MAEDPGFNAQHLNNEKEAKQSRIKEELQRKALKSEGRGTDEYRGWTGEVARKEKEKNRGRV